MLIEEPAHLFTGKGRQEKRLCFDIKRRPGPDGGVIGTCAQAILADVAQSHKGDGLGEVSGASLEAVAELAQGRDEDVVAEGVHLVEQEDEGFGQHLAPIAEILPKERFACAVLVGVGRQILFFKKKIGHAVHGLDEDHIGLLHRYTGISCRFERAYYGDVLPLAIESVGQGMEEGGFACLPGCMDKEVLLIVNQVHYVDVQMPERIHHIVSFRGTQASSVEKTSHGAKIRGF